MTKAKNIDRIVYDSWDGGFKSKLRHMGKPSREYIALNMHVYDNGTLGTRPWLRLWPDTGMSTSTDWIAADNSSWCVWRPTDTLGELVVGEINGDVWVYDFSDENWTVGTTHFSGDISAIDNGAQQGQSWGNSHDWEHSGQDVGSAQHAQMPLGNWILGGETTITFGGVGSNMTWTGVTDAIKNFAFYRDRIWGWHTTGVTNDPANRLYYTNAGSYTTAASGNYIDIGAASQGYYWILGVWALRDSLLICMSNGSWFVFTGTPESGSLRYIGDYVHPPHGAAGAVINNAVYFLSPYGRQVCIATPSGVDTTTLRDIRPWVGDKRWTIFHNYRGLASQPEQTIMLPTLRTYEDQFWSALERINGSWTWSGYGADLFTEGVGATSDMGFLRDTAIVGEGLAYAFLCEDEGLPSNGSVQLYTRDAVLNRPSRSTDRWSDSKEVSAGSPSTTLAKGAVRLAPYSSSGEEVRVRQVIVDYYYWHDDSTTYETPDMACKLINAATEELESVDTYYGAGLDSFEDINRTSDWAHGIPSRWVFRFPLDDQDFRNSIQVQLDDIMSIAISKIVVDYEVRPDNHWAGQAGGT